MNEEKNNLHLHFSFDWRVSLLAILLLPGLIWLGFWQLDRAEEKRQVLAQYQHQQVSAPVDVRALPENESVRYLPVKLQGHYLNEKNWLLDNKIYHGRFGYEIITAFQLTYSPRIVLVNRGWIQADPSRREPPRIEAIKGEQQLLGRVYVPQGEMLSLGEDNDSGWPRVLQSLAGIELGPGVYPWSVRLQAPSAGSYIANWQAVNIQPEKHTAYTFQWFAMAFTVVLIALLANTNLREWRRQRKAMKVMQAKEQ